jgi:hypothetical protein
VIPDQSAEEAVVFDPTNVKWNDVFRRSTLSPVVFVVAPECSPQVHQILEDLGLPKATGGFMYLSSTSSAPLLDGLVISLTNDMVGTLPSRTRVVGIRPMRLLCDLLGIEPPSRRVKGEPSMPTLDELHRELELQMKQRPQALMARANLGLGVDDPAWLQRLVVDLFGEDALDDPQTEAAEVLGDDRRDEDDYSQDDDVVDLRDPVEAPVGSVDRPLQSVGEVAGPRRREGRSDVVAVPEDEHVLDDHRAAIR